MSYHHNLHTETFKDLDNMRKSYFNVLPTYLLLTEAYFGVSSFSSMVEYCLAQF